MEFSNVKILSSENVYEFVHSNDNIVIYGAGNMGLAFYDLINDWNMESHVKGFASSRGVTILNNKRLPVKYIDEWNPDNSTFVIAMRRINLSTLPKVENEIVFLVDGTTLRPIYKSIIKERNPKVYNAIETVELGDDEYVIACQKQLRDRPLNVGVDLVAHCNLNCQSCNKFSPIASEYFLEIETFESDMKRLSELCNGELGILGLLGGEPLLHPKLIDFLYIARKYFPKAEICSLLTNGTLMLKQDKSFWKALRDNDITVTITRYPVSFDYDRLEEKIKEENIKSGYSFEANNVVKTSYRIPLDEKGERLPSESFFSCEYAYECSTIREGRIYTCQIAAAIKYFNNFFNKSIYDGDKNSVSLYEAHDIGEIMAFLRSPMPICRQCNIRGKSYGHPWAVSKRDISEWT